MSIDAFMKAVNNICGKILTINKAIYFIHFLTKRDITSLALYLTFMFVTFTQKF